MSGGELVFILLAAAYLAWRVRRLNGRGSRPK